MREDLEPNLDDVPEQESLKWIFVAGPPGAKVELARPRAGQQLRKVSGVLRNT